MRRLEQAVDKRIVIWRQMRIKSLLLGGRLTSRPYTIHHFCRGASRSAHAVLTLLIVLFLASACNSFDPRPTPDPIFVTATPLPITQTPTPADTSAVGPTPLAGGSTDAAALRPPLIPAT